ATALVRALKATGHDLHDLWQIINSATTPAPRPEQPKAEQPKPKSPPEWRPWRVLAIRIRHSDSYSGLTDKEINFLDSMMGLCFRPSERQQKWLDDIAAKVFGGCQ